MYIKSLEYIHELLSKKTDDLNELYSEICDGIESYASAAQEVKDDANNASAFAELKKRLAKVEAERDLVAQIKSDFERTNWH